MQGPSIVVGIDFGTTFSGVAWALEGSIDDIEVLTSWPGAGNTCRGIKLLFDEDQESAYAYAPSLATKSLLQKHGKDAVRVAGDYMSQLMRQVAELIQRRLGVTADDSAIQFALTDATLRAAIGAGAPTQGISLVSEPEAAALYALRAIQPNSIARDDVFIVCDAGGGTVDLISYVVKDMDPLRLMEATKGTDRICGSMLLDNRFEDLLRNKMGAEHYDALLNKSKEATPLHWQDRVKPLFAGKFDEDDFSDVSTYIPLPGAKDDPDARIEDGFFELTTNGIAAIFDPIVRDVVELIDGQIGALGDVRLSSPTMLLVGGFGASEYLFCCVQQAHPSIKVLQPPNSWSVVVSGAVHHGLESHSVESLIARRNYGVTFRPYWDPERHTGRQSVERPGGKELFSKYGVPVHSKIAESEPIRVNFYRAENQTLAQKLSESHKQHLADTEKIQRLTRLLLHQARDDISRHDRNHRKELADVYSKLNAIQSTPDKLPDGQIIEQMNRLHQQLENWTKTCFKDQEKLSAALEHAADGFPRTRPQRYAWVQSWIVGWIYQFVFAPYLPGLPGDNFDRFCGDVEVGVQESCLEATLRTWRVATSSAIQHLGQDIRTETIDNILAMAEYHFGSASSLEPEPRHQRLHEILERCTDFKYTLRRQPDRFFFDWSQTGDMFAADSMTAVGGDREEANVHVRLCVCPGLLKRTFSGDEEILAPQLV
ncbi:hypothetical protein BJX65DRAFT_302456 [Aspergillus insuetus]